MLMLENPACCEEYMEFFLEYNDAIARLQLAAGADAIWLGDCVATSNFISRRAVRASTPPGSRRASSRRIRAAGGIVFYHGGERPFRTCATMAGLAFDAHQHRLRGGHRGREAGDRRPGVHHGQPGHDRRCCRPRSPEAVERDVARIVETAKPGGGYIFCTGEGITHDTPVENVKAMVRAVRENGRAEGV